MERIGRDQLFMSIAELMAQRGTCPRAEVGAVIVRDGRIVSSGYVGSPPKMPHCLDEGCETREGKEGCFRTIHAEANAIYYAAKKGIEVEGGTMYCTHLPCEKCAQAILASGIKEVVFKNNYREHWGLYLLVEGGVKLGQIQGLEVHEVRFTHDLQHCLPGGNGPQRGEVDDSGGGPGVLRRPVRKTLRGEIRETSGGSLKQSWASKTGCIHHKRSKV